MKIFFLKSKNINETQDYSWIESKTTLITKVVFRLSTKDLLSLSCPRTSG